MAKLASASRTDVGKVRESNEDAYLDRPEAGIFAVADGMGGHADGHLASSMIVEALTKIKQTKKLSELVEFVEYHILKVNEHLFNFGQQHQQITGSTIVALLVMDDFCAYMWAGDSRLYRLRDGHLEQLTIDHTQTELYIEQGLIERKDAEKFASRNRITRAVGAAKDLILDVEVVELQAGDRFLLCSDGLDKHLLHTEIAAAMQAGSVEVVSDGLIEATLDRGANDNVTVCIVDV